MTLRERLMDLARYKTKDRHFFLFGICAMLGILGFCASQASAQCQQAKLTAADAAREGYFGASVDIDGDVAIVGAVGSTVLFDDAIGAAYIFRKIGSNWVQEQKLGDPVPQPGVGFGWAVAINGDTAMITAPGDSDAASGAGAAHVFHYDGGSWVQTQKLYPSDPVALKAFGWSVAIEGNVVAVGQVGNSFGGGSEAGGVYVYRWNGTNWAQEQKLAPPDLGNFDHFGASVSVSGNRIVGGAPGNDPNGAAYVFNWNGSQWIQQQKLIATDGQMGQSFGSSVAIEQEIILVGDPQEDGAFTDSGSVRVFNFNGSSWVQQQKLIPPVEAQYGSFGAGVSLHSNHLLIAKSGAAYLYSINGPAWPQPAVELIPTGIPAGDGVGSHVGLSLQGLILGAPTTDEACPEDPFCASGSAYIYDVSVCLREIPAISTWGLVILILSVVIAGVLLLRRKEAFARKPWRQVCDFNAGE